MAGRIIREHTVVDQTTGEVINSFSKTTKIPHHKLEQFMMLFYTESMKQGPSTLRVLFQLMSLTKYNDPVIDLSAATRRDIMQKADLNSPQSLTSVFTKLKADQWIAELDKGRFLLNPYLSWKGELEARNRYIKENKTILIEHFGNQSL